MCLPTSQIVFLGDDQDNYTQANLQSQLLSSLICVLIFWGQFEALQIMCYNWKKVFLIKTAFYYHFQLSFDNENWFFLFLKSSDSTVFESLPQIGQSLTSLAVLNSMKGCLYFLMALLLTGPPMDHFSEKKKNPLTEPILKLTNWAFHGGNNGKLSTIIDLPSVVKNTTNYTLSHLFLNYWSFSSSARFTY